MSIKQAIEALETCLAMAEHGDFSTGYCCCGSSVEGHTMGDGHSPVDEGDYHAINAFDKARAALTALRSMPQGEPVAWAATSEDGEVEALGMNQSRRFDTPLCFCATPHTEAAHCIACGEVGGHKDTCARVRWGIAHTEAVRMSEAWISVDERLPGEQGFDSEEVMLFINGHCEITDMECRQGGAWGLRLGYFDAEKQAFRVHGRPESFVTHWMPLPPPPAHGIGGENP